MKTLLFMLLGVTLCTMELKEKTLYGIIGSFCSMAAAGYVLLHIASPFYTIGCGLALASLLSFPYAVMISSFVPGGIGKRCGLILAMALTILLDIGFAPIIYINSASLTLPLVELSAFNVLSIGLILLIRRIGLEEHRSRRFLVCSGFFLTASLLCDGKGTLPLCLVGGLFILISIAHEKRDLFTACTCMASAFAFTASTSPGLHHTDIHAWMAAAFLILAVSFADRGRRGMRTPDRVAVTAIVSVTLLMSVLGLLDIYIPYRTLVIAATYSIALLLHAMGEWSGSHDCGKPEAIRILGVPFTISVRADTDDEEGFVRIEGYVPAAGAAAQSTAHAIFDVCRLHTPETTSTFDIHSSSFHVISEAKLPKGIGDIGRNAILRKLVYDCKAIIMKVQGDHN